jgi:hypothetical protein
MGRRHLRERNHPRSHAIRAPTEERVLPLVFGPRARDQLGSIRPPNGGGAWVQGGDTLQHAVDPVSIPHDVGNQGVATGNDRKLNPQVCVPFPPPQLVTESARTTLSRWRHGFEPVGTTQGRRL